jgi:hypothetical protein
MVTGHEYLIIASASLYFPFGSSGGDQTEGWISFLGGQIPETYGAYNSSSPVRHSCLTRLTADGLTNVDFILNNAGSGVNPAEADEIFLMAIDLDSDGALTNDANGWLDDSQNFVGFNMGTMWGNAATINFTPAVGATYLVIGQVAFDNATAPDEARVQLYDFGDSVPISNYGSRTAEHPNSAYNIGAMAVWTPSSVARMVAVQAQGSGAGMDIVWGRIFLLRLDNFQSFAYDSFSGLAGPADTVVGNINTSSLGWSLSTEEVTLGWIVDTDTFGGIRHTYTAATTLSAANNHYKQGGADHVPLMFGDARPGYLGPHQQKFAADFNQSMESVFVVFSSDFLPQGALAGIEFSAEAAPTRTVQPDANAAIQFGTVASGGIVVDYLGDAEAAIKIQAEASAYSPLVLPKPGHPISRVFAESLSDLKPQSIVRAMLVGLGNTLNYMVVIDATTVGLHPSYGHTPFIWAGPPDASSSPLQMGVRKGDRLLLEHASGGAGLNDGKYLTIALPSVLGNPTHMDVMEPLVAPDPGSNYYYYIIRRRP